MNYLDFKKLLIKNCHEILMNNFKAAETEMNAALQAANESGPPKDRYDPFRSQMLNRRNMFAEQCNKILSDAEILKKINTNETLNEIHFGAVVLTNSHKLFFAIALGKVKIKNEVYFVASTQTPLFEAMKNKTTGDEFVINCQKFIITDVF